jgi:hypothetical protein
MQPRGNGQLKRRMEAHASLLKEIIDRVEISWCMDSMSERSNVGSRFLRELNNNVM